MSGTRKLSKETVQRLVDVSRCYSAYSTTVSLPHEHVDCVVIGSGIIGLSVARQIALHGRQVLLLDSKDQMGGVNSSRNSEVVHGGMYYAPGSLKAKYCVQGRRQLFDYCNDNGVRFNKLGKYIVATDPSQVRILHDLMGRAHANGVEGVELLDGPTVEAMEPNLRCIKAILSPESGVVDSKALMSSLLSDATAQGTTLVLNSLVLRGSVSRNGQVTLEVNTSPAGRPPLDDRIPPDPDLRITVKVVVNSAGLDAIPLASRISGMPRQHLPKRHLARGCYFWLTGFEEYPFARLVYPVPEDGGIGIHVTVDLNGRVKFGPDVEWIPEPESPDGVRFRYDFGVDSERANRFYSEIRKYFPSLPPGAIAPAYSGIRPKIIGPGEGIADFMIQGVEHHGVPGLINLFGIESPGLTSSFPIGAHVAKLVALSGR